MLSPAATHEPALSLATYGASDAPGPDQRSTTRSRVMESPDGQLIAAVLNGDESSFEELIKRHQTRVFGSIRRYVRNETDVQDVAQEVFVKAFEKLNTFRAEAPFEHWLMRMTVRCCFDYLRKQGRNREMKATDMGEADWDWLQNVADPANVEDADHANAARQLLAKLMAQLPPAAQMVLNLLEIQEKSVKEIAELTGWSVPLVKVRAFRARAQLKKLLAQVEQEKYL